MGSVHRKTGKQGRGSNTGDRQGDEPVVRRRKLPAAPSMPIEHEPAASNVIPLQPTGIRSAAKGRTIAGEDDPRAVTSQAIGEALKTVYQRTLNEAIPPDFLDLLDQLK